jgi:hypothetical protein
MNMRYGRYGPFFSFLLLGVLLVLILMSSGKSERELIVRAGEPGIVEVRLARDSEPVRSFRVDRSFVVRETFVLGGGEVVGASQWNRTTFWDYKDGEVIGEVPARVYLFTHKEDRMVTFDADTRELALYSYPEITKAFTLEESTGMGPERLEISPDDKYLVVRYNNHYPISDNAYGKPLEFYKTLYRAALYDLVAGRRIEEFDDVDALSLGGFSEDSRYFNLINPYDDVVDGTPVSCFDLITHTWQDATPKGGMER